MLAIRTQRRVKNRTAVRRGGNGRFGIPEIPESHESIGAGGPDDLATGMKTGDPDRRAVIDNG